MPVLKNAREEKYVQGLISGLSQRKAYRGAYKNSKKWKDTTVDSKASKLLKEDKVMARYNELLNEHKKESLWNRAKAEEKLNWLLEKAEQDLAEQGFRQANSTAFLNAIKELNEISVVYPLKAKQIEKINKEINTEDEAEKNVAEYIDILKGAITDESE